MMKDIPVKYFGDTCSSVQSRKRSLVIWIERNENIRPSLVRAAKALIHKLCHQIPLEAPCLPLDRCIELCPSYIAKAAGTSPQTARNAWIEVRDRLCWGELKGRKGIESILRGVGYNPRSPSYGARWGTHIFLKTELFTIVNDLSDWLHKTKRYECFSFVENYKEDEKPIVRITDINIGNPIVNIDTIIYPHCPPKGDEKRSAKKRKKRERFWTDSEFGKKSKKEKMAAWMEAIQEADGKRSKSKEQRKRESWLLKMSKVPAKLRHGLYVPGEDPNSETGRLALLLIAELNEARGRVFEVDEKDLLDDWFGYELAPKEGFNLPVHDDISKHGGGVEAKEYKDQAIEKHGLYRQSSKKMGDQDDQVWRKEGNRKDGLVDVRGIEEQNMSRILGKISRQDSSREERSEDREGAFKGT